MAIIAKYNTAATIHRTPRISNNQSPTNSLYIQRLFWGVYLQSILHPFPHSLAHTAERHEKNEFPGDTFYRPRYYSLWASDRCSNLLAASLCGRCSSRNHLCLTVASTPKHVLTPVTVSRILASHSNQPIHTGHNPTQAKKQASATPT